jgi:hypothetical protein
LEEGKEVILIRDGSIGFELRKILKLKINILKYTLKKSHSER